MDTRARPLMQTHLHKKQKKKQTNKSRKMNSKGELRTPVLGSGKPKKSKVLVQDRKLSTKVTLEENRTT